MGLTTNLEHTKDVFKRIVKNLLVFVHTSKTILTTVLNREKKRLGPKMWLR